MPIWNDPLDELIGDLERTIPTASMPFQGHFDWDAMLVGCQLFVAAIMSRSEERIARVKQDPRVKAWLAWSPQGASRRASESGTTT